MYGEVNGSSIVPPVVATGSVAVLPATGADVLTTLAIAVGAGLITWAALYYYKVWNR